MSQLTMSDWLIDGKSTENDELIDSLIVSQLRMVID
jgi:hypothetical protein